MTENSALLSNVLKLLAGIGNIRQRKMFGGVYIYCDDLFIATVHDNVLYFKANAATAPDFVARGLQIFSYPREGAVATLQYYQAPPEVFNGPASMRLWAEKTLQAARQDAAAKPKRVRSTVKANGLPTQNKHANAK
jgi:DNA transformation protein and related proteins